MSVSDRDRSTVRRGSALSGVGPAGGRGRLARPGPPGDSEGGLGLELGLRLETSREIQVIVIGLRPAGWPGPGGNIKGGPPPEIDLPNNVRPARSGQLF